MPDLNENEKTKNGWELVWSDEFDYENKGLDEHWDAENGSPGHILSSRWRENVVVENGLLYLKNKKENRGGKAWTAGSISTKQAFKYGRYECRYKYGASTGLNNSFWLIKRDTPSFELDINEGKYPNKIDMNIHDWSKTTTNPDGSTSHPQYYQGYYVGLKDSEPSYTFPLDKEVKTKKIRFVSTHSTYFHIREFRVFPKSTIYPYALSDEAQLSSTLINHAKKAKVTASGVLPGGTTGQRIPENVIDGKINTSWISQDSGEKFLLFEWEEDISVGCIQLVNGWKDGDEWKSLISNFKVEYWNGKEWISIADHNLDSRIDLSADFHVYAIEWNEDEIIWFYDDKEIRRERNLCCHHGAPIYLSSAVIDWAGPITDKIDGTSMVIDWVRVYQRAK